MRARLTIYLAATAAALALLPLPASAQMLPPYEIATSVRSMGLMPVSQPVRKGQRYVLVAVDRRGNEVKVAADAFTGRILFVEPQGYGQRPLYAERSYPQVYPEETVPPRGYDQRGYQRQTPPRDPGEPSVIYAPREGAGTNSNPAYRPPTAAKPPSRVATKPPSKPAASADSEASAPPEQAHSSTEGTNAAAPPAPPVEKNPALTAPPVQGLE